MADGRQQFFEFLDERVFHPILTADTVAYASPDDRKLLKNVQRRVRESRTRHAADYRDASAIKANFIQDLNSKPRQAFTSDVWQLGLTRFEDLRPDFAALCKRLGV
jgi:hypothetical protein